VLIALSLLVAPGAIIARGWRADVALLDRGGGRAPTYRFVASAICFAGRYGRRAEHMERVVCSRRHDRRCLVFAEGARAVSGHRRGGAGGHRAGRRCWWRRVRRWARCSSDLRRLAESLRGNQIRAIGMRSGRSSRASSYHRFVHWSYADDADTDPRLAVAIDALNIRSPAHRWCAGSSCPTG
jgi:hypothetical protein